MNDVLSLGNSTIARLLEIKEQHGSGEIAGRPVYILGAGFSRAVSEAMPLLHGLSEAVAQTYSLWKTVDVEMQSMLASNFEDALSFLVENKPWVREAERLHHRALFLDLSSAVAEAIHRAAVRALQEMDGEIPEYLGKLIRHWHQEKAVVISLNYDTLVEALAGDTAVGSSGATIEVDNLYPNFFTAASRRNALSLASQPLDTFRLLKLHGSSNWYYSGQDFAHGEVIYYKMPLRPSIIFSESKWTAWSIDQQSLTDKYPLIIPPIFDKGSLMTHESLRGLWAHAALALEKARRVTMIGYSLPSSDKTIRRLLKSKIRKGATVEVIDRNNSLSENFSAALDHAVVQRFSGDHCLASFVKSLE